MVWVLLLISSDLLQVAVGAQLRLAHFLAVGFATLWLNPSFHELLRRESGTALPRWKYLAIGASAAATPLLLDWGGVARTAVLIVSGIAAIAGLAWSYRRSRTA